MNEPITQSDLWKKLQDDLREKSFFCEENSYKYLAILKSTPAGNYLYLPYGPVVRDQKSFDEAIKSIKSLAKEEKAIFIRIEPQNQSIKLPKTAKKSKDLNPADTWVLDLTADREELIHNFSQGTRTRFNTYAKKGLLVEKSDNPDDIKHLVALQNKLYKEKHLNTFSEEYLRAELEQPFASLYLVKYEGEEGEGMPKKGQILCASLFFDYDDTRYYMQSAADLDFRKLPATVALLTTAIFDAKEQGIKLFDFWGIAPDGAPKTHPWYGFTDFKKSFGGYAKHYHGTYDIVENPLKYRLYKRLRKLNRLIRHAWLDRQKSDKL